MFKAACLQKKSVFNLVFLYDKLNQLWGKNPHYLSCCAKTLLSELSSYARFEFYFYVLCFLSVIDVFKWFFLFIAHKKCFAAELSCWFEDFIFETANGWMCLFVEGCAVLAKVCEHFDDFTSFLGLVRDFSHGRWSAWVCRNPPRFLILV